MGMRGRNIFLGSTAITVMMIASQAFAQDRGQGAAAQPTAAVEDQASGDEIVVTGRAASLARSIETKREQNAIVDAISAEDVGKFPDNNIAESLQRVTGVEITRNENGEGQYVSIRGLPSDFSLVTWNGMSVSSVMTQQPNTQNYARSRSFDFGTMTPDFISSLVVYKSAQADLDEGGIAGTINVKTLSPFDIGKQRIVLSVKGQATPGMTNSRLRPQLTAVYSNVFADDRFGITVGGDWNSRVAPNQQYANVTWGAFCVNPTDPTNVDASCAGGKTHMNYQQIILQNLPTKIRTGTLYASLQWKPGDDTTVTLNGLYVNRSQKQRGGVFIEVPAFPWGSNTYSGPTNDFIVDENNMLTSQANSQNWYVNRTLTNDSKDIVKNISLDIKSKIGRLDVEAKGIYSDSRTTNNNYFPQMGLTPLLVPDLNSYGGYRFEDGAEVPGFIFDPKINYGDPNQWGSDQWSYAGVRSRDRLTSFQLDTQYEFDGGPLSNIKVGAKYVKRSVPNYIFNYYHDIFGAAKKGIDETLVPAVIDDKSSRNILDEYHGPGDRLKDIFFIDPQLWLQKYYGGSIDKLIASPFTINQISTGRSKVSEENISAYAMANYAFDIGIPIHGNVGVRYQRTSATIGYQGFLISDAVFNPACAHGDPCQLTVPGTSDLSEKNRYSYFLPSMNLIADLTDDINLRFSVGKSMARPTLSSLPPNPSIDPNNRTITEGNAGLKPFLSTNLDASFEWYFSRSSMISVAAYYKKMSNFVQNVSTYYNVETVGLPGGTPFQLTVPLNASKASVKGVEADYKQFFSFLPGFWSGFGLELNLTYSSGHQNAFSREAVGNIPAINVPETPFLGLTKITTNATLFYEKYGFSGMISLNHRDSYLNSIGVTPGGLTANANLPLFTYTKARNQLDAQVAYDVTSNFKVFAEATNLTNEPFVQYSKISGVDAKYPQAWTMNGRGVAFGLKASF